MTAPLRMAVVGHTNTGKTSLMRTLMRDPEFGEVSDRPAVTRDVAGTVLLVNGKAMIELYDTPGLEDSINLLDHLHTLRGDRREEGMDVVRRFLESPEAHGRFAQEAKAIGQLMQSDVALYVIDARDRVLGKHRDELEILRLTARPIVPVLNFIASDEARTGEWREHLSRAGLHAVAEFDTVVVSEHSEQRLYEKIRTLLDQHREVLDALIHDREQQRKQLISNSAASIAELLIDAAAFRLLAPAQQDTQMTRSAEALRDRLRTREQRCVDRLLALHRFHPDDCEPDALPIEGGQWGVDLFSAEAMRQLGIRASSGAAAGAMAGVMLDAAVGGTSLGLFAAGGAAIGALFGASHSHGRRVLDRLRGYSELRADDTTLSLLAMRALSLVRALLVRGHASQQRVRVGAPGATISPPSEFLRLFRRARSHPEWSALDDQPSLDSGRRMELCRRVAELVRAQITAAAPGSGRASNRPVQTEASK